VDHRVEAQASSADGRMVTAASGEATMALGEAAAGRAD
jgi:hypothetical protein